VSHGEAVGYGMLFALGEAVDRGLPASDAARIARLIETVGLPRLRRRPHVDLLLARMRRDKKASEQGMVWVVPRAVGEGEIVSDVESEGLHGRIGRFLATITADEIGGPPDG
jgi:3-dehydroquinate synthase